MDLSFTLKSGLGRTPDLPTLKTENSTLTVKKRKIAFRYVEQLGFIYYSI